MLDYQGYADFYVFLPYAAIGFGWLLFSVFHVVNNISKITAVTKELFFLMLCGVLIISATVDYRARAPKRLELQKAWANEAASLVLGADIKTVSIGNPQALVLLHKTNPNPYIFVINGIDNHIHANTPGGFDGWLESLRLYDPDIIFYGATDGKFKPKLEYWLGSLYQEKTIGKWTVYVKGGTFN